LGGLDVVQAIDAGTARVRGSTGACRATATCEFRQAPRPAAFGDSYRTFFTARTGVRSGFARTCCPEPGDDHGGRAARDRRGRSAANVAVRQPAAGGGTDSFSAAAVVL
jgi:hypothetical protein